MKTQTTFDDLVLEFPALEEKQGRALKGGVGPGPSGTSSKTGLPFPGGSANYGGYNTSYFFHSFDGGWLGSPSASSDNSMGGASTPYDDGSSICYTCYSLDYNKLPKGDGSDRQIQNWCVFKTMEIANHYFGGSTDQGTYVLSYAQNGHPLALSEGFYSTNIKAELYGFVNQFFHTNNLGTNVEGVKDALANNHPVMATLMFNGVDGHEVLITQCDTNNSFDENNRFTYFDPQEGRYKIGDASIFSNMIEVKGRK